MFYCNGIQCGRSVIALEIAKGCGYTRLYWFRGGFAEWKRNAYVSPRLPQSHAG